MYVSKPMTDDQPLMRYFTHDKFLRLLDPSPSFMAWQFLDPQTVGRVLWKAPPRKEYGSLWMAYPQGFKDKDEGTFPALNADDETYCAAMARQRGLSDAEAEERKRVFLTRNPERIRKGVRACTRLCGVSCWYQDSTECEQMWREYVPDGKGVVVKTTLKRFEESLAAGSSYGASAKPMFATINYVDLDKFFLAVDGYYHLLTLKGEGWKHEREVRLIAKSPHLVRLLAGNNAPTPEQIEAQVTLAGPGFNFPIDVHHLAVEIRVHPFSPAEYIEEVRTVVTAKGVPPDIVCRSALV